MMEEGWLVYFCLQSCSRNGFCTHTPSPHLTELGRQWRNPARSAGRCTLFCSDWSKIPAAAVQASVICSHRNTNVFTFSCGSVFQQPRMCRLLPREANSQLTNQQVTACPGRLLLTTNSSTTQYLKEAAKNCPLYFLTAQMETNS